MKNRLRAFGAVTGLAILTALVGCEDGRVRSPTVNMRVVHAAPTTTAIDFYREARPAVEQLDYRGASGNLPFDADEYDFHVRIQLPANTGSVLVNSFSHELLPEHDYLVVLTEIGGLVQPLIISNPVFSSTTETQVTAVHAAPSLGAMDVYFAAPGADLTTVPPLGGAAFTSHVPPAEIPAGDYVLTLTAPGDPATVLFTSVTLAITAGQSNAFVIVDTTGDGVAPFSVTVAGSSTGLLIDQTVQAGVEVVNAAADGAARDVFVDADYTVPLIANLPYGSVSALTPIAHGTRNLSVTPQGNPGVVEDEQEIPAVQGGRFSVLVAGDPGSLSAAVMQDDPRRVTSEARVRFMNGSGQHTPLQYFLLLPGSDLAGRAPVVSLATPGISQRAALPPGDYELTLLDSGTGTVVNGPQPVTFGAGIFTILAVNGAAAGTVDTVLLEDFN